MPYLRLAESRLCLLQMVWVATTRIGCAFTDCAESTWYVRCHYSPAGRGPIGAYAANVLPGEAPPSSSPLLVPPSRGTQRVPKVQFTPSAHLEDGLQLVVCPCGPEGCCRLACSWCKGGGPNHKPAVAAWPDTACQLPTSCCLRCYLGIQCARSGLVPDCTSASLVMPQCFLRRDATGFISSLQPS
jgi:hypothetical protein